MRICQSICIITMISTSLIITIVYCLYAYLRAYLRLPLSQLIKQTSKTCTHQSQAEAVTYFAQGLINIKWTSLGLCLSIIIAQIIVVILLGVKIYQKRMQKKVQKDLGLSEQQTESRVEIEDATVMTQKLDKQSSIKKIIPLFIFIHILGSGIIFGHHYKINVMLAVLLQCVQSSLIRQFSIDNGILLSLSAYFLFCSLIVPFIFLLSLQELDIDAFPVQSHQKMELKLQSKVLEDQQSKIICQSQIKIQPHYIVNKSGERDDNLGCLKYYNTPIKKLDDSSYNQQIISDHKNGTSSQKLVVKNQTQK